VTALGGGALNRSFRLRVASADLVLKLAGRAAPGLGANLEAEAAMQSLAAGAGLAPAVVHADPAGRFIVTRHAAGRAPRADEMRDSGRLRRLGRFAARLHALEPPPGLPVVDFGARAARYLERVEAAGVEPLAAGLVRELGRRRAALPAPPRLAPCHHDLHRRNLLEDGARLLAVDWEYAGPGDPAADLAACVGYHGLDGDGVEALLAGYGAADAALRERLAALGWIFDCLWFGWNAAAALDGNAPDAAEQARLAARLRA
jgi:aminoglycoside phosphotransferase (APT) family kinase protein